MHALDVCLRKCLPPLYPRIRDVRLTDYKVRVLDSKKGTAAKVRVLVEWSDHQKSWSTVGVSDDVIEASWNALVDALAAGTDAPDAKSNADASEVAAEVRR